MERVGGVYIKLIVSHIPQRFFPERPNSFSLDCRLHDVEGQISQAQELLDSGRSVNPGQLRAQLAVLSEQREGLLVQKRGNLRASSDPRIANPPPSSRLRKDK